MERSKFVSGVPKEPRPKCSTMHCLEPVYSKTINHCDDCIAKFNKSVEDARPVVAGTSGTYVPQYSEMPITVPWDGQNLTGEEYNRAVMEAHRNHPRPSEVISESVHIPLEIPRLVPNDFNFE